jgi:Protein of unknown function (DUF3631)/Toprim domain
VAGLKSQIGTAVQLPISDADNARLNTWIVEIASDLRQGAPHATGSEGEVRVGRKGSLALYPDGHWYDYEANQYGPGAFALILHDNDGDPDTAALWATEWLRTHAGSGSRELQQVGTAEAEARAQRHAEWAQWVLQHSVPIVDTPSAAYLEQQRGLPAPHPAALLGHLERGRKNECALVARLTDPHGTTLGIQLGFLGLDGRKSMQLPTRQQFWRTLDPMQRNTGLFRLPAAPLPEGTDQTIELAEVTLIAEGVENSLSVALAYPSANVIGLPGIGRLRHLPPIKGDVLIVRDGDESGSPADKSLRRGIDHLLLVGAKTVRVTETPPGEDANSILQSGGTEALRTLIGAAKPAALSSDGEAQRLAKIRDPILYAQACKAVAKAFGVDKGAVEAKVATKRKAMGPENGGEDNTPFAGIIKHEPTPWTGQVVLGEVFDELVDLIRRLLVCTEAERRVIAAWIMHSYIAEQFTYTPRLCIISPVHRCGKTTLVNTLTLACYRPAPAERLSPALFTRLRSVVGPCTIILDEIGEALHATPELDDVLRSGFERGKQAFKLRAMPDGSFVPEAYEVFNPVVLAVLRTPPAALADRCLVIRLQRKPKDLEVERLRRRDVRAKVQLIADKLARWRLEEGAALSDDPPSEGDDDPLAALTAPLEASSANDRQIDFSIPLLVIGNAMGADRERQLRDAVLTVLNADGDTPEAVSVLLLQDLRPILDQWRAEHPQTPADKLELSSAELVRLLQAVPDSPWAGDGNIRPLTQYRLARLLKTYGVFTQKVGPKSHRLGGYSWLQLLHTCERYDSTRMENPDFDSDTSDTVGNMAETLGVQENFKSDTSAPGVRVGNAVKPAENGHIFDGVRGVRVETGIFHADSVGGPNMPSINNPDANNYSLHKGAETPSSGPSGTAPAAGSGNGKAPPSDRANDTESWPRAHRRHPEWRL